MKTIDNAQLLFYNKTIKHYNYSKT